MSAKMSSSRGITAALSSLVSKVGATNNGFGVVVAPSKNTTTPSAAAASAASGGGNEDDDIVARAMKYYSMTDDEWQCTVRSMLVTDKKNFVSITHPPSITTVPVPLPIREDIPVHGARVFQLHGLLSRDECDHFIDATESVGYRDLSKQFDPTYRSNDRVLVLDESLADSLWNRIKVMLNRHDIIRVRPMCFGNGGTWKPTRLNECFKFNRYGSGGHFSPHLDGPWVPREDESSIYTVIIYLNDGFQGGATRFWTKDTDTTSAPSTSNAKKGVGVKPIVITPRAGTALIFNHDVLHDAEPVAATSSSSSSSTTTKGNKGGNKGSKGNSVNASYKYMVRTEVMFTRVDTAALPKTDAYLSDPNYIKALALYRQSHALDIAGDTRGFTDSYLRAIELQHQAQLSIASDRHLLDAQRLPYTLYLQVFTFLPHDALSPLMTVSKTWYDMMIDGWLWRTLFYRDFAAAAPLESALASVKLSLPFFTSPPKRLCEYCKKASSWTASSCNQCWKPWTSSSIAAAERSIHLYHNEVRGIKPSPSSSVVTETIAGFAVATDTKTIDTPSMVNQETKASVVSATTPVTSPSSSASASASHVTETKSSSSTKGSVLMEPHPYLRDWYGVYRRHWFLRQHRAPVILDIGSDMIKYTKPHLHGGNAYMPHEWLKAGITACDLVNRYKSTTSGKNDSKKSGTSSVTMRPSPLLKIIAAKFGTAPKRSSRSSSSKSKSKGAGGGGGADDGPSSTKVAPKLVMRDATPLERMVHNAIPWSLPVCDEKYHHQLPYPPQSIGQSYRSSYEAKRDKSDPSDIQLQYHHVLSQLLAKKRRDPIEHAIHIREAEDAAVAAKSSTGTHATQDETKAAFQWSRLSDDEKRFYGRRNYLDNIDESYDNDDSTYDMGIHPLYDHWYHSAKAAVLQASARLSNNANSTSSSSSSSSDIVISNSIRDIDSQLSPLPVLTRVDDHHTHIGSMASIVARIPGMYDIHMRRPGSQRYFVGSGIKDIDRANHVRPVRNGMISQFNLIGECLNPIFRTLNIRPERHPLIVAIPSHAIDDASYHERLCRWLLKAYTCTFVLLPPSSLLTLLYHHRHSGIVVTRGHEVVSVSAVSWCKQLTWERLSSDASGKDVAQCVVRIVTAAIKLGMDDEASRDIVLTGGRSCEVEWERSFVDTLRTLASDYSVTLPSGVLSRTNDVALGGVIFASLTPFHRLAKRLLEPSSLPQSISIAGAPTMLPYPRPQFDDERAGFYMYQLGTSGTYMDD